jgi:ribosome maturation protein SDO1
MKKGLPVNIENVLAVDQIFYDFKKGLKVSSQDLKDAFGTDNIRQVAEKIIKSGEIVVPSEYRKKEQDIKVRQVIDFLLRNALDAVTNKPITEKRITEALDMAGINIENKPIEQQIPKIVSKLKEILPLKIETKKLKVVVPAIHTGKVYGLLQEYKEKENWLGNGDLSCIVNIPSGFQMEFYDKLNAVTHGSAIVEEVK